MQLVSINQKQTAVFLNNIYQLAEFMDLTEAEKQDFLKTFEIDSNMSSMVSQGIEGRTFSTPQTADQITDERTDLKGSEHYANRISELSDNTQSQFYSDYYINRSNQVSNASQGRGTSYSNIITSEQSDGELFLKSSGNQEE